MTQGTALNAFHGDASVRTAALQRLAAHRDANELTTGLLFLGSGKYSPAAALVDAAESDVWQERTGLAAWIAYALDSLSNTTPPVETATSIIEAVNLGSDTADVGSAVIEAALSQLECNSQSLAEMRDTLRALHARARDGDAPSSVQWRVARKLATEVADKMDNDLEKRIAACVEASAWSPVTAPTSVAEVLRAWTQRVDVDAQLGWDATRHAKTREKLGEMHKRYIEGNPDEKRDVFKLLEEHDPQWATDIKELIAGERRVALEQGCVARDLLIQILRAAK